MSGSALLSYAQDYARPHPSVRIKSRDSTQEATGTAFHEPAAGWCQRLSASTPRARKCLGCGAVCPAALDPPRSHSRRLVLPVAFPEVPAVRPHGTPFLLRNLAMSSTAHRRCSRALSWELQGRCRPHPTRLQAAKAGVQGQGGLDHRRQPGTTPRVLLRTALPPFQCAPVQNYFAEWVDKYKQRMTKLIIRVPGPQGLGRGACAVLCEARRPSHPLRAQQGAAGGVPPRRMPEHGRPPVPWPHILMLSTGCLTNMVILTTLCS